MKKRLLAALLMAVLLLPVVPTTAHAASAEANYAANALYQLGLFSGTGNDAQGNPVFDLDRTPSRYESVTMLVRLLGKADEAKAGSWNTPFTDLTVNWAKAYVGYAYEKGLTSGASDTAYGGAGDTYASQYISFVLRALGYESGVDFKWNRAWELSDRLDITDGRYDANTTSFTRGDVAIISYNALNATVKGTNITLREQIQGNEGNPAEHVHSYVTKTIEGHYEEVQIGTKTVNDYAQVTIYGCRGCDFTTYEIDELNKHCPVELGTAPHAGVGTWSKTTTEVVGTHEEPRYSTRWIEGTIRVCEICGQQE